ncbi:MAG: HIT family protein [Eubacterium sp.]|nr:HIT family protein [Eubacterium sp.]
MEAMKDDNCIFCKLANGDIPTRSIYEDDTFRVFLDAAPATKGHALIVPKNHVANLYELPEETAGKALILAKKMATHMTEKLGCDGFNVVQNNGEIAGQTVFHFHMHLIPRYKGDANMDRFVWNPTSPSDAELDAVQTALKLD